MAFELKLPKLFGAGKNADNRWTSTCRRRR